MTDLSGALPLYAQIAARLRAQIGAGEYAAGSRVPSEHELAKRFRVGRPTVRQATELLVNEQVLERRRGSGTYVSQPPRDVDLFSAGGTLASFARSGVELSARLLGRVRRRLVVDEPRALAGREVFFLARRSSVADSAKRGAGTDSAERGAGAGAGAEIPVLLEEMYFDPEVFPGLDRLSLAGRSLSELARERYLLRPETLEQRFSVVALDAERAKSLGLARGSSVLCVERTLDFTGASGAFRALLWCRTDTVSFTQKLVLERSGAGRAFAEAAHDRS